MLQHSIEHTEAGADVCTGECHGHWSDFLSLITIPFHQTVFTLAVPKVTILTMDVDVGMCWSHRGEY